MRKSIISVAVFFTLVLLSAASSKFISGEFEGKYRVGVQTCVVKPIKMAFEVTWIKKREKKVYFYELDSRFGNYAYISKSKGRGYDRFVFADDRHVSGEFIRSNGQKYPLIKIR